MALNQEQIGKLLELIATAPSECVGCDQCYEQLAEFAEAELNNRTICEALQQVQDHLRHCPCCQFEFEVLRDALIAMNLTSKE